MDGADLQMAHFVANRCHTCGWEEIIPIRDGIKADDRSESGGVCVDSKDRA